MESHPDRNPDDPVAAARFKEASEAYAVLSDAGRRRSYDMFGHSAVDTGGAPVVDFSDIFDTFFGGGFGGRTRRQRSGSGDEPGTGTETCPGCGGAGQIRRAQQSIFGSIVTQTTCPTCGGAGRLLKNPCTQCRGQGRTSVTRKLAVRIRAGVDT